MTTQRWLRRGFGLVVAPLLMLALLGDTARASAGVSVGAAPTCQPIPTPVPEIDPGSVFSAFTLLTGGLMVMTDRRRSK